MEMLTTILLYSAMALGADMANLAPQAPPLSPVRSTILIFLHDTSASTRKSPTPGTAQAALLHMVNLAELSKQPVSIAVVCFGGDGVTVFGDGNKPTAAYAKLRSELTTQFPSPAGATPMDEGFEKTLQMVRELTGNEHVCVVLMTDGQPDSGKLRPEDFPDIAAEIERRRKAVLQKYQDFPPGIIQHYASQFESEIRTPGTETFNQIYEPQRRLEFQKTLEHAAALGKQGVRLVTLNFGPPIPQLQEIHRAAAATPTDMVVTDPNQVIAKLHALGVTALPRIVIPPPLDCPAQPGSFTTTIEAPLDPIAEAALVTLEFAPAIAGFDRHATLKAIVGGNELPFASSNTDTHRMLAFDAKGNVATATILLDTIPSDARAVFRFESPSGSLHVPACTAYTFLRLSESVSADFRPSFASQESIGPFRVSPDHSTIFRAQLRTEGEPKPYPLQQVEVVLHDVRTRAVLRLGTHPDPQSPGVFLSDKTRVPAGIYDAELHLILESGAAFSLTLHRHLTSETTAEAIYVEIPPRTADAVDDMSASPSHIDFGQIGDVEATRSIVLTLRSLDTQYPITAIPSFTLADPQGSVPSDPWITFDPPRLVLPPGRAEKLRLTLRLPDRIEENIEDGPFEGKLILLNSDLGQPLVLRRYEKIVGADDDAPVDRITFTLKRPSFILKAPYTFRNWLKTGSDGSLSLPIFVSIGPLERQVTFEVAHDGRDLRTITVLPSQSFVDSSGRRLPSARLVPAEGAELTQDIAPGHTGRWCFRFFSDEDCSVERAFTTIDVSAPGLATQHLSVVLKRRDPPLASTIRIACWIAAGVCLCFALVALFCRFRIRRFVTGAAYVLSLQKPLRGALVVQAGRRRGTQIVSEGPLRVNFPGERKARNIPARRPLPIDPDAISPARPLILQVLRPDGSEGPRLAVNEVILGSDGNPELCVDVTSGGSFDDQRVRSGRSFRRAVLAGAVCILLAATLHYPGVIRGAQWIHDFFNIS
jgi:hypothetical protein